MKKFSEHSGGVQLAQILAAMTFILGVGGSFILWAADSKIDQKYATDDDVLAVQTAVQSQVEAITTTVKENTATVRATASSVDGLTLVVLDLQVSKVQEEIVALEADKRREAAAWNERDERSLRDQQKALEDLRIQRNALFSRLIASTPTP